MTKLNSLTKTVIFLIIVAGLLANITQPKPSYSTVSLTKISPILQQWIAERNLKTIPIFVLKNSASDEVEKYAQSLGANIRLNIEMMNAFAADISADGLQKLMQHPGVKWISPDNELESSVALPMSDKKPGDAEKVDLVSNYVPLGTWGRAIRAMNVDDVWGAGFTGKGIGVAVIDSGVTPFADLVSPTHRLLASVDFVGNGSVATDDQYGHGTHVASVIAGNGKSSGYMGVAPEANIINLKTSNEFGMAKLSAVIAAIEWVLKNKDTYNIRVVNLSLNIEWEESYHKSPLCAAVEILWFNNIVVVTSAGNRGPNTIYPPANDPFVISVGAVANYGTDALTDDAVAPYSSYGTTLDKFSKPDVVAHGYKIRGVASKGSSMYKLFPDWRYGENGFKMSGTSASAPLVSGVAALVLQRNSKLNPDQVKYLIRDAGVKSWSKWSMEKAGEGQVDALKAVKSNSKNAYNTGVLPSRLLTTGSKPINSTTSWNSVSWNSVSWNSVSWNSTTWQFGLTTPVFSDLLSNDRISWQPDGDGPENAQEGILSASK